MRDTTVEIATSIRSTAGASALFAAANAYHDSPPNSHSCPGQKSLTPTFWNFALRFSVARDIDD